MSMDESKVSVQSVVGAEPEASEFVELVQDPDLRLQWIREHLGEEAYQQALELRRLIEKRKHEAEPS